MKRFRYWTDCIGMPGGDRAGELVNAIRHADADKRISYATFARHADLEPLRRERHPAMYRISAPDNWAISFHRSELPSGAPIYYFAWSGIEHFFVDQPVDIEREFEAIDAQERDENPAGMRYGVRQDEDALEVRAVSRGRVLGKLDAQRISYADIMEEANELAEQAQQTSGSEYERLMARARRFHRCAASFDRLQTQLGGHDLDLFTVVSVSWEDGEPPPSSIATLYRIAAVAAGRRGAALVAEPCTEHLFGGSPEEYAFARIAWKHPEFRRGLVVSGPVAYAPAVAPARAANLKRFLLR